MLPAPVWLSSRPIAERARWESLPIRRLTAGTTNCTTTSPSTSPSTWAKSSCSADSVLPLGRLGVFGSDGRIPSRALDVADGAYARSHRAAVAAAERLDRALGRQPEIEPPHRSLGVAR